MNKELDPEQYIARQRKIAYRRRQRRRKQLRNRILIALVGIVIIGIVLFAARHKRVGKSKNSSVANVASETTTTKDAETQEASASALAATSEAAALAPGTILFTNRALQDIQTIRGIITGETSASGQNIQGDSKLASGQTAQLVFPEDIKDSATIQFEEVLSNGESISMPAVSYRDIKEGCAFVKEPLTGIFYLSWGNEEDKMEDSTRETAIRERFPLACAALDEVGWNLRSAYDWSVNEIEYDWTNEGGPAWPEDRIEIFADWGFTAKRGDCFISSATFCEMAAALGYDAYMLLGAVRTQRNPDGSIHSWVEIDMDGEAWVFDPEFEAHYGEGWKFKYGTPGTWQYITEDAERMNWM